MFSAYLGAINKELDRRGGQVTSSVYGQANSQDVELAMEPPSAANVAIVADTSAERTLLLLRMLPWLKPLPIRMPKLMPPKMRLLMRKNLPSLALTVMLLNLLNAAEASLTLNNRYREQA